MDKRFIRENTLKKETVLQYSVFVSFLQLRGQAFDSAVEISDLPDVRDIEELHDDPRRAGSKATMRGTAIPEKIQICRK